jgi:hypothetical protein
MFTLSLRFSSNDICRSTFRRAPPVDERPLDMSDSISFFIHSTCSCSAWYFLSITATQHTIIRAVQLNPRALQAVAFLLRKLFG